MAQTSSTAPNAASSTRTRRAGKRRLSPGRRQYLEIKAEYPDALLLFRMGDFYEAFDEDARVMADVLDITLTARDVGGGARSPLAGIPYHALDSYLGRLISAGLKVAICEQTSDPAAAKGIVDRAVVRLVTPGTVLEPGLLDHGRNNFLAAAVVDGERAGIAYIDITTSEFVTQELPIGRLRDELDAIGPAEVILDAAADQALGESEAPGYVRRKMAEGRLDTEFAAERLRRHFGTSTLEPFGCESKPLAAMAAAAVLEFLRETQMGSLPQVTTLRTLSEAGFMVLDRRARRDLEVFEPLGDREGAPTLLGTLDLTRSPLGKRLLRDRVARPLMDLDGLVKRQDGVAAWLAAAGPRAAARDLLDRVPDMERLTNRVRAYSATPRDLAALARGLAQLPGLVEVARSAQAESGIAPVEDARALIDAAIADEPPMSAGGGEAIRPGFDTELDELRTLSGEAQSYIAGLEATAREETGIKSLKVGYNKVFGYYIEVSRSNLEAVPEAWDRRQSLVGAERFITPELKEYEAKVLNAVDPEKDVDGFHPVNVGKLLNGEATLLPCTPHGCQELLLRSGYDPAGKHVVVLGRSNIVGKPMAAILMQKAKGANATVTVCHSRTKKLASITKQADILIAAIGMPNFVTSRMVKDGVIVIDVGTNRVPDKTKKSGYRLVGDVDFKNVSKKARAITPVPGGVGPMTITMLMQNTVEAAKRSGKKTR